MYNLTVYTDEELRQIQKIEKKALAEIIRICEQLQIECFVIGGTTLGAIRHNGFIPWDDDIDVGMTRENYIKFIKSAEKYLSPQYHLQTPYGNVNSPYIYTKVRIDGTKFVEYPNRNLKIHQGVYIDVFPFDEVPDDENLNLEQFKKIRSLIWLFGMRQAPDRYDPPKSLSEQMKQIAHRTLYYFLKIIPHDFLVNIIDNQMQKYNGTGQKALACLCFPRRKVEYVEKINLWPLKEHQFEDLTVPIPGNYDEYLKTHYGEYMKLPPREERYGHKPWLVELE